MRIETEEKLRDAVWAVVHRIPAVDFGCRLYDPRFGNCLRGGVSSLLADEGLVFQTFGRDVPPDLSRDALADEVWSRLFLNQTPLDEARRTVLTSLGLLQQDVGSREVKALRQGLDGMSAQECAEKVFAVANLRCAVSAADPFDEIVRASTEYAEPHEPRFRLSLSVDSLFSGWKSAAGTLVSWGYEVSARLDKPSVVEVVRFLRDWHERLSPAFVSLQLTEPLDPEDKSARAKLLQRGVIPFCLEKRLPLSVGGLEPQAVAWLLAKFPALRLWVQPSLAGSWPVLPGAVNLRLLARVRGLLSPDHDAAALRGALASTGSGFVAYASESASLLQLPGRWAHFRWLLATVLRQTYLDLHRTGWRVTEAEIERDVRRLMGLDLAQELGLLGAGV